jgi:hypothetical protein
LIQIKATCGAPEYGLPISFARGTLMTAMVRSEMLRRGIIAGAAGGLAEMAWVTLYAGATGGNAAVLARGVTSAAGVSALLPAHPVGLGIAVHMILAMILGVALASVWQVLRRGRGGSPNPYPFTLGVLGAVWGINFFVVLPLVSPTFVHLVPYVVSLTSKLLFGIAAAAALSSKPAAATAPSIR